eukprot:CAMPEP_0202916076 /NCGR_PEP_ID=MMETSP1392-20130828/67577_1 /ASSEMBLY_ACC=CAM_ASM_000868 /TAXON_ID=225041 /ORGANISM="Chlamydomonas chlamydogama, Strain SAG 11-48b" /LENGTH=116 /DNA_ID=CAMNT_0049608357 /DNA_START=41 /DNA_END=391 /DNA_ORIENTATION=-
MSGAPLWWMQRLNQLVEAQLISRDQYHQIRIAFVFSRVSNDQLKAMLHEEEDDDAAASVKVLCECCLADLAGVCGSADRCPWSPSTPTGFGVKRARVSDGGGLDEDFVKALQSKGN